MLNSRGLADLATASLFLTVGVVAAHAQTFKQHPLPTKAEMSMPEQSAKTQTRAGWINGKYWSGPAHQHPARKLPYQECRVILPDGSAYTKYECLVPKLEAKMDRASAKLRNGTGTQKQYRDALEAWSKAKAKLR